MDNKTDFRTKAKIIRKELDINKISMIICEKIKLTEYYKNAKHILVFYPLKYEVNLLPLINDSKQFYLPRINGDILEICPYKINDKLTNNEYNIKEPNTQPIKTNLLDLIILPALAADKNNNRLGYGKGFYDKLLSKTDAKTILPIPKALVFDKIPTEKYDQKVNLVITE